ncbi:MULTISPECIES: DUF333 domain-containing protein [Chromobacterium]|uniref:DUF333 domain-containing protein n=1 Tax=Chromobacterium aquaticum TaxID=467180 RepID=A0ABV8ZY51_9NEIS|nr:MULTISPECIES: DUF333 domain-containing protein [Chromobacterium]KMN37015.1 hemolysin [Chromobacterium sp. LK1]MCD5363566.1 DUF333 domain-containing protein [Chromobacterium aquaticum]
MRILICAIALLGLSACSQTKAPEQAKVGMANPASVYCGEKGGKLLPQKDAQGNEYALCQLPDGRTVEEWTLFRADHPQ